MTGYIVLINLCSFVHIFVCLLFRSATTTLLLFNEEVPQPKRAKRVARHVYDENDQRKDWSGNIITQMDDEMNDLDWHMSGKTTIRDAPAPFVSSWAERQGEVDSLGWGVPSTS